MDYPLKMTKTRQEMLALGLPGGRKEGGAVVVETSITDQDRWSTTYDLVFRLPGMPDDLAYSTWYRRGSTEQQDESPWEYEDAECTLVRAAPVTRIEWQNVEPSTAAQAEESGADVEAHDIITPETLDNLRALLRRQRVPHSDAPINTDFAEMAEDLIPGEPLWVATSSGREVVDLADRVAIIAGKALWFDDSADYGQALWDVLAIVHPTLARLIDEHSDEAEALLFPPSTTPTAPE